MGQGQLQGGLLWSYLGHGALVGPCDLEGSLHNPAFMEYTSRVFGDVTVVVRDCPSWVRDTWCAFIKVDRDLRAPERTVNNEPSGVIVSASGGCLPRWQNIPLNSGVVFSELCHYETLCVTLLTCCSLFTICFDFSENMQPSIFNSKQFSPC